MSGEKADRYVGEILLAPLAQILRCAPDPEEICERLESPYACLEAIYSQYAFARRGKDRSDLAAIALIALHRLSSPENFGQLLAQEDAEPLWESFVEVCAERKRKPMEQLNAGVIAGMAELAQEVYQQDGKGSIASWVVEGVRETGRIEPQFLRMVDVRGIGPKITSLFLRDIVYLFDLEARLDHADRLLLQPIDKWMRSIAPFVMDEPNADDLADWVLAGKLSKYARRAGVSGIRFNMGVTWFGMAEVRAPEFFSASLRKLLQQSGGPRDAIPASA